MNQLTRLELSVRHVTWEPRNTYSGKRRAIDNVSAVSLKTAFCLKALTVEGVGVVPGIPLAVSCNPKTIMLSEVVRLICTGSGRFLNGFPPRLSRHRFRHRLVEVGLIGGFPVKRRMRTAAVVQLHARTPTLSNAARFFIDGILGLADWFMSIR